eukprot:CAMPEP_0117083372 /NCGR_PEP_ID=MMETSP0472-20121206/58701_1 /TAXON_ID=693140 ORGANISM="Tiarina fusus, Strain LIS" /NCGR_SAMPLE_ID=MMETSP0472 /ASSEMBLY_ACC=CAM_ASM_000603 /LENGTH=527 /DNA_ID=CAMNT_0004811973 /DNA_START=49 /DNA_END=1632 /DNA_ORIENTATION=+
MTDQPSSSTPRPEEAAVVGETWESSRRCCKWMDFHGSRKAQGFAFMALAHGSIYMSNVFLSTAFIYLASEEAGCIDEETGRIITTCENRVYGFYPSSFVTDYGFYPSSFVTNIATIAGLLTAFVLPVFGAIIDFTANRRLVGRWVAAFIVLIQGAQISVSSRTWFPMAILQAIVAALFEIHYLLAMSYLPDVVRYDVDEKTMNTFTSYFLQIQFGGELVYVFIITAEESSSTSSSLPLLVYYFLCPASGRDSWDSSFAPCGCCPRSFRAGGAYPRWRDATRNENTRTFFVPVLHKTTRRWCRSIANPKPSGSFSRRSRYARPERLKYNAIQIGAAFFIALLAAMPGTAMSAYFAKKYNPAKALKIMLVLGSMVTLGAVVALREERAYLGYVWAALWGITIGWYWSGEQLLFSVVLPEGQEAELTGFFVYCTIILSWICPLIYSLMVEAGVPEHWGLMPLVVFKVLGFFSLLRLPEWDEVRESTKTKLHLYEDDTVNNGAVAAAVEELADEGVVKETEVTSDSTGENV